jgi:hypothetical protein
MDMLAINGISIHFPPEERPTAELLRAVTEKSQDLIDRLWGLAPPKDCRLYIMTSWTDFYEHAAPRQWQILIKILSPILTPRFNRMWPYVGGWEQRFGSRVTVGIKPLELLVESNNAVGRQIFKPTDDNEQKFAWTACHELTHAFSSQLKLPAWLKEGIAMLTVDHYASQPTVQSATLQTIAGQGAFKHSSRSSRKHVRDPAEMISIYVQGYWITRYIEETRPGLLNSLFDRRQGQKQLEENIATAYNYPYAEFWMSVDERVVDYFQNIDPASEMGFTGTT